jgi:hypothetical protein
MKALLILVAILPAADRPAKAPPVDERLTGIEQRLDTVESRVDALEGKTSTACPCPVHLRCGLRLQGLPDPQEIRRAAGAVFHRRLVSALPSGQGPAWIALGTVRGH